MTKSNTASQLSTIAGAAITTLLTTGAAMAAPAGWDAFVIRTSGTNVAPVINEDYNGDPDTVEFIVDQGSQKAGLGTSSLDGFTIGQIQTVSINRLDDYTSLPAGSGAATGPYMNFWVTDGQGHYAVLANEPSNPEWPGNSQWNTTGANLATKTAKVYEKHPDFVLPAGSSYTFADFADYEIDAPDTAYIGVANHNVGTGAPDELGTNLAYGFNWVFGDTLSNYVGGYIVSDPVVSVPEPTTLSLLVLGGAALLRRRRGA